MGRVWKNPLGLHLLWVLVLLKLVTPPVVTVLFPFLAGKPSGRHDGRRRLAAGRQAAHRLEPSNDSDAAPSRVHSNDRAVPDADRKGRKTAAAEVGVAPALSGPGEYRGRLFSPGLGASGSPCWRSAAPIASSVPGTSSRRRVASAGLLGMAERIAKRLGLRRVPFYAARPCLSAGLVAWRPAAVFLPAELFERLDGAAREAILAHELAHVRRRTIGFGCWNCS